MLIGWLVQLLLFTAEGGLWWSPDLFLFVCKIETFLALIVMLIVSLATLTTGVQEESSSARGK